MGAMKNLGALCLAGMVTVTCVGVVGRMFNHPIFGTEEIVAILSTFVIAMTLPYAHKEGVHIGVELLVRLFSRKYQDRIKFSVDMLALVLFSTVTWRMFLYAGNVQRSGVVTMNLELPEYYVIYMVAFCFLVFSLMILSDVTKFFTHSDEE